MSFIYILITKDNSYYIGSCNDLSIRISNHKNGEVKYTKSRLPIELIYTEEFDSLSAARKRELQIKKWKSRSAIERLINQK